MKKRLIVFLAGCLVTASVFAQYNKEESEQKGFKKENLFTGGSVTVSFFNGQTVLGGNPIFGYKLADWVDAGIAVNFLYSGYRDYYEYNDRVKQTVWGPGVFTRLYPVPFLFVQAQLEQNFTTFKYTPAQGSFNYAAYKDNTDATSLLLGGGFASGRQPGSNTFFYVSLLFDVLKDMNSPYVSVSYNPSNPAQSRVDVIPIIRAGVNVGLFQGRYH